MVNGETETHILMKLAHNLVMKLTFQPIIVFVLVLRYGAGASGVAAQEEGRCAPADRFLTEELAMVTRIDTDALDDWRTGKRLAACRITGSGARRTTLAVGPLGSLLPTDEVLFQVFRSAETPSVERSHQGCEAHDAPPASNVTPGRRTCDQTLSRTPSES